jgi:lipopolysaccharide transport protein LptA
VLLAGAVTASLSGFGAAQPARETLPINVEAASLEGDLRNNTLVYHDVTITQGDVRIHAAKATVEGGVNYQRGTWTLAGEVRITTGTGRLDSDEAVIHFANNAITRAIITGSPAQFEQQREGGAAPARGHANSIDYETATENIRLNTGAWLSVGCTEIRSERLVYNLRSQAWQAARAPDGTGNGRPVRFTIQPQTASGEPCSTPGKTP